MSVKATAAAYAAVAAAYRHAATLVQKLGNNESNGPWGEVLSATERHCQLALDCEKAARKPAPAQQAPSMSLRDQVEAAVNGTLADKQAAWTAFATARPKLLANPTLAKVKPTDGASIKRGLETALLFLAAEKAPATVESKPVAPVADNKPATAKDASQETVKHNDKPAAKGKPAANGETAKPAASCPTPKADGSPCKGKVTGTGYCAAHSKNAKAESTSKAADKPAAPKVESKPEASAPFAVGTVLVADGKGGVRVATEADLWAALEKLNGKKAA